jgi:riboflavin synthase
VFTGLVERTHRIEALEPTPEGMRLHLAKSAQTSIDGHLEPWGDLQTGESIAVNGACLTLVEESETLAFDVIHETLRKTSLGQRSPGEGVHLERALRLGDRLGGHYVTGHVDALGTLEKIDDRDGEIIWTVAVGDAQAVKTVPKGSITLDGVSLTVVDSEKARFSVALIPHTLEVTAFSDRKEGDLLNLEMDHFGRWVESLLREQRPGNPGDTP